MIGTVIEQGPSTQNPNMLAYGEEGDLNRDSRLYAVNDTFVNDLHRGDAIFAGPQVTAPVFAENDISTGGSAFRLAKGRAIASRLRHDPPRLRRPRPVRLHTQADFPVPARRHSPGVSERLLADPSVRVRPDRGSQASRRRRHHCRRVRELRFVLVDYSQNAISGIPIRVTRCVLVSTANCSLPPPFFGIRTSVTPNVPSVEWSTLAFG